MEELEQDFEILINAWLEVNLIDTDLLAKLLAKVARSKAENLPISPVVESKPTEKAALNHAVSAIYFNDRSDYLKGLYGVVRSFTGIEEPTDEDIERLFKELNPE